MVFAGGARSILGSHPEPNESHHMRPVRVPTVHTTDGLSPGRERRSRREALGLVSSTVEMVTGTPA